MKDTGLFETLADTPRTLLLSDPPTGLRAVLCLDDDTLGPFVGGIRTWHYDTALDVLRDARRLARAMTIKCALAGLDAGGGKTVVWDHPGLQRDAAFEVLGHRIEELGGRYQCAGDLGTGPADLAAVARGTRHAHTNEGDLARAVGRSIRVGVEVVAEARGVSLGGLRVVVQGAGAIGRAAAEALAEVGAGVAIADRDAGKAEAAAAELGLRVLDAKGCLAADADVLVPCATGGVLGVPEVAAMRAWGLVPGANNTLRDDEAARRLAARGVLHVPDALASAGAVMEGIGRRVMKLDDVGPLFDTLASTARTILARAADGTPADTIARELAMARVNAER